MDSRHGKVRMNVEGERLSNLPDDLIHKILSFIGIKHAIQTSALSSRWRYIWTSMPCIDFSSEGYYMLSNFSKFVTHLLPSRNNQIDVSSVKLTFHGNDSHAHGNDIQVPVKKLLDYAFSHNVQQLNISCLRVKNIEFPRSLFSSQSLKHLTLTGYSYRHFIMTPPTWELPALATLNLCCVTFSDDYSDKRVGLFSNCANLKNLTLKNVTLVGLNEFVICHPGLSSLTLEDGSEHVNVVTPQLKNLVIKYWRRMHLISAPNLSSMHYEHYFYILDISADLPHLEKVDIRILNLDVDLANYHKMVPLLQRVHNVKFLTLNSEIIEFLSSSVELISNQPSPFANLKSVKIYPFSSEEDEPEPNGTISTEVKNYFLDSSPGATLTMVSHEEIIAAMNIVSAHKLMRKLQVMLDQLKENSETDTTDMEQVEVENHRAHQDMKVKWQFGVRMAHIKSYWKDLNEQMENGYKTTGCICSMLHKIKGVLRKLPASDRAKLQTRFSGLCLEADTLMDDMMDRMKDQCDKKPRRLNVYFH
ncbi:putative F-box domain, leucine-rich repeat domain superfamily, F-box-like domain superfamily [Helianthus debilis subsp. tardiflorus]